MKFDYVINAPGIIEQTQIDDNDRRAELIQEDFKWFGHMVEDMFA